MVGYAASADESGNSEKIIVTVLLAEDFSFKAGDHGREVYAVSRDFKLVHALEPRAGGRFSVPYGEILRIATLLHIEELRLSCACAVKWRYSEGYGTELLKTDLLDNAWLPLPLYNENCELPCVNITNVLFANAPKPLEASLVCDMLNFVVLRSALLVSHPFYNCHNSVFCSVDVIPLFMKLLGDEFPFASPRLDAGSYKAKGALRESDVLSVLSTCNFPASAYDGNSLCFLIDAKRDCQRAIMNDFADCIVRKSGWEAFAALFSEHISKMTDRVLSLSQSLVIAGNVDSLSDVLYLSFYELHNAFAFYDTRLCLKKTVRTSKHRQRILNGIDIPDYI